MAALNSNGNGNTIIQSSARLNFEFTWAAWKFDLVIFSVTERPVNPIMEEFDSVLRKWIQSKFMHTVMLKHCQYD